MNNKGLTLMEVIATLILLSIIALIVTPNIYQTIKNYQSQLLETQLNNVKESAKNWVADNIDKVPSNNSYSLKLSIQDLQSDNYIEDKLKNPRDGGYLDDSQVFVLISCDYIVDETNNMSPNYKYTYGVYENIEDYLKKMAIEYTKDHSNVNQTLTTDDLKNNKYIVNSIKDISNNNITIPFKTVEVVVEESEEEINKYIYTATFK